MGSQLIEQQWFWHCLPRSARPDIAVPATVITPAEAHQPPPSGLDSSVTNKIWRKQPPGPGALLMEFRFRTGLIAVPPLERTNDPKWVNATVHGGVNAAMSAGHRIE